MRRSLGQDLRSAASQSTLQIPGAPNALMGRLIERIGFPAVYLSGGAFSASALALPDVGLFTLSELVTQTRRLTQSVNIPVVVDADTGFGDVLNVERTVRELESAGAAAIQLEDQTFPKRCGHLSGKQLVEPAAMVAKVRAAVSARTEPDTVIIARTDARGVEGFDAAIERAEQYTAAGADWVFPEALVSADEFATFANRVTVPLLANMTEFGKGPLLSHDELAKLGFAGVLYPVSLLRAAMKSAERLLTTILRDGTQASELENMQTRAELYELLDYHDFGRRDQAYLGASPATAHETAIPSEQPTDRPNADSQNRFPKDS